MPASLRLASGSAADSPSMATTLPNRNSTVSASAASLPMQRVAECDTLSFNSAASDGAHSCPPQTLQKMPLSGSSPVQHRLPLLQIAADSPPQKDVATSSPSGQSMPFLPTTRGAHVKVEVDTVPFSFMGSLGMDDVGMAAGKAAPSSTAALPSSFLTKTFNIVDDPSSNTIVSWGPANNSFVIWDPLAFSRDLLPRFFKHSNFSSFVRQLNTYIARCNSSSVQRYGPKFWYEYGTFCFGKRRFSKGF